MPRADRRYTLLAAAATSVAYYVGAHLGSAFTTGTDPVSAIWPPNAILFGALLCTRTATWPIILLAVLPAHLIVQLHNGVPLVMALSWFVSNCSEALFGAACIRRLSRPPVRFDSFRRVVVFVTFGAFLAPFLSSFLDIGLVQWNAWTFDRSYWYLWRARFFSNVLAVLTIVPVVVPWDRDTLALIRHSSRRSRVEGACLAAALVLVAMLAFAWRPAAALGFPLLIGIVLPCLLWSAVRFGPRGSSLCLFGLNILSITWAVHEPQLFAIGPVRDNILALQLYLIGIYIPIMALAAVIRERARAEAETRENEHWLNAVLDAAQMGSWSFDLATQAMSLSERSQRMLGVDGASRVGAGDPCGSLPEARASILASAGDTTRQTAPYEAEFRVHRPDGGTAWIRSRGDVVRDDAGRAVGIVGVHADITEQKLAEGVLREQINVRARVERALRASEERCAKAFRASPDAISIERRSDGHLIEVNERWSALLGFAEDEAIGRTFDALRIGTDERERARFDSVLSQQGYVRDFELDVRTKRGDILRVVVVCDTVEVGGEECLITMMRDVTERRRAEREIEAQRLQLAHLGRVALLGELSGAVAHELNQPLTAILANTRAAQRLIAREDIDREELKLILEDVATDDRRAGDVIRRFRALLRKGDTNPQQVVMNDLVDEVLGLARSDVIQRGATVMTNLMPSLPAIAGDRVQLQQLILNLLVNACDAMTENAPTERRVDISTEDTGSAVRLSVSDCGTGISADPLESVFEPFVTSKQHGLGLGLSICRSIVGAHGGRLWAENNPVRGATFHLLLPRSQFALYVPPLTRLPDPFRGAVRSLD